MPNTGLKNPRSGNSFKRPQLRAFDSRFLILYSDVTVVSRRSCSDCDVSFLTRLPSLHVYGVVGYLLIIPTTIISLVLKCDVRDVFVSDNENLVSLEVPNDTITTTVPETSGVEVAGETLSTKVFSYGDMSSLSTTTIPAHDVEPLVRLPVALTALFLYVTEEPLTSSALPR